MPSDRTAMREGRTKGESLLVRMDDELLARLRAYSDEEDRPMASVARLAIRHYLDQKEGR